MPPSPSSPTATTSHRPRLGIDFHVWDDLFQGSRSHLLGLYEAAIVQAPEIDFVFFLGDTAGLRRAHPAFGRPNVTLVPMRKLPGLLRLAVQMPWLQWRHHIDLLHMQYRLPLLRLGPCACTIHDVLFETHPQFFTRSFTRQLKWFSRQAARHAALLLTVSEFSRRGLAQHHGLDPQRIVLTHNGVDTSRFHPGAEGAEQVRQLGLEPGRYLLTVGRLEPRKNHATLIEAYARLAPDSPDLVIVGQRDFNYSAVFDTIEKHRLQSRVKLLTSVGDALLPAAMRHARLFVYPSFAEGFGMPVLEAMVSGVPVITSNTTALPEVAGQAARLIDPHSVQQLAAAMQQLLNDPAERAALLQAAPQQAGQFAWETAAAALLVGVRGFFARRPARSR